MGLMIVNPSHVIVAPSEEKLPPLDGFGLSDISGLVQRAYHYMSFLRDTHEIIINKWTDYDGFPLEDFFNVDYDPARGTRSTYDQKIVLSYRDTTGDEYDYVAMAARDTTTAYKRGRRIEPTETKFKIERASFKFDKGDAVEWGTGKLSELKTIVDGLDAATDSLISWAVSDLDMKVYCTTNGCRTFSAEAIIPNSRLRKYADKGMALGEMKERMKCKKCGRPAACLLPHKSQ